MPPESTRLIEKGGVKLDATDWNDDVLDDYFERGWRLVEESPAAYALPHETCRYYLARTRMPGAGIEIVDGCHDSPEGVVEAARLHERIFHAEGPWTMIEATPLPEIAVEINEPDAELCRRLVDGELCGGR